MTEASSSGRVRPDRNASGAASVQVQVRFNRMVSNIWYQHGIGDRTLSARGDVLLGKPESSPSSSSSSDSPPTASSSPGRDAVRAMRGHRPLAGGGQARVVGFSEEDELVSG